MFALLALAVVPAFNDVQIRGWTRDGAAFVYQAHVDIPDSHADGTHFSEPEVGYDFLIVTDANGGAQQVFRVERKLRDRPLATAEEVWQRAQPPDAGDAWLQAHQLVDAPERQELSSNVLPARLGGLDAELRLDIAKERGCRHAALVLKSATTESAVASDTCAVPRSWFETHDTIQIVPSPDSTRVAIAWRARMSHEAGSVEEEASHAYLVVVSARTLASVDVLDAGAAAKTDAVARTLGDAGFRIGHRGKAQKPRAATAIYFVQGFEQPARDAAKLLGVPAEAVQPATWKTPYAVTVAAGP